MPTEADLIREAEGRLPTPDVMPHAIYVGHSDAQRDWLTQHEYDNYRWAEDELETRRLAYEVQQRLRVDAGASEGLYGGQSVILHTSRRGGGNYSTARLHFFVTRYGGLEELLLIEEAIRRAKRGETW